jgi:hypothetical protein
VLHISLTGVELVSSVVGVSCNAKIMGERGNCDQNTSKTKKQKKAIILEGKL